MYVSPNQDSLYDLFKQKGLDQQFPVFTRRLETSDIKIPDLRRTIRYGELVEMDRMIKSYGGSWDQFPGFSKPEGKKTSYPKTSPGTLYMEEPEGGFTRAEKLEIKEISQKYSNDIPDPIKEDFQGLTDLEARIAFNKQEAIGARLVEKKDNPELIAWLEWAAKTSGIPTPRLVITESDVPQGLAMSLPRIPATIFISSNLVDILDEKQLKAVIGHEIGHVTETLGQDLKRNQPRSLKERVKMAINEMLFTQPPVDHYGKEYRADGYGALLTSANDMASALLAHDDRLAELGRFSTQLKQALKEQGIPLKDLPGYFGTLTSFEGVAKPVLEKSRETHKGDAKKGDTHPPTEWRLEHLNKGREPGSGAPIRS